MSAFKTLSIFKTLGKWSGLGPDEGDPYDGHMGRAPRAPRGAEAYAPPTGERYPAEPAGGLELMELPQDPVTARPRARTEMMRPRLVDTAVRPVVVRPSDYDEAQLIGDHFKQRQPVIVTLHDLPSELQRRLVDFSSGLCYALDGQMEQVEQGVYLITPNDTRVALEEGSYSPGA